MPAKPMNSLIDIAGWAGAVIVLIAYTLVSTKKLTGTSFTYQFLNVIGALF